MNIAYWARLPHPVSVGVFVVVLAAGLHAFVFYPQWKVIVRLLVKAWDQLIGFRIAYMWYWLRTHTVDRYHILDLRGAGYGWGWIDRDEALMRAAFICLEQYVEGERDNKFITEIPTSLAGATYEYWENIVEHEYEVKALYDWWKRQSGTEGTKYEDEQRMLHRLIDIRSYLWT